MVNRKIVGSSPACGSFHFGAELTHQPVNQESRARERLGFLRLGQYSQGFMRCLTTGGEVPRGG